LRSLLPLKTRWKSKSINNYFGIGVDGHISLIFDELRRKYPVLFFSQTINKFLYMMVGIFYFFILKQQELQGKKPQLNSGRARQRADDLEARKVKRLRELDSEADLVNQAPRVVAAALILPQGLVDRLLDRPGTEAVDPEVKKETDRRAIAAVMSAERSIGRVPVEQSHNNPGFDILSEDPVTGMVFQIEVKGHRPETREVNVHARQVRQAQQNPERFRLAIVLVPDEAGALPSVSYFIRPFDGYDLHFAQTGVPLSVAELAPHALEPQ
jgi:hypothetical protein